MFKSKGPVVLIVLVVVAFIAGIVVSVVTGGEGASWHWEFTF